MNKVCFLVQIKHTNGIYEKGVVVKTGATLTEALDAAKQGFHAYFSAYGYGHDANTDYVACMVVQDDGLIVKNEIYDNRSTSAES